MRADRLRWDARYASGERRHDSAPSSLLAAWLPRLRPGRALDVAAGLGRHALLLAHAGWRVDAVDGSREALRILRRRAEAAGAAVNLVLADLDRFACRAASYNLIVDTFFLERRLVDAFAEWLRPGGRVFFETHLATDPAGGSRYALQPGEAARLFGGWDLLAYEEGPARDGDRTLETVRLLAALGGGSSGPGA
jgi:tellurite methyltransferase